MFKTIFINLLICIGIFFPMFIFSHKEEIKTYLRINRNIGFILPDNYVKRNIENEISLIVNDPWSRGVYVLCLPNKTGKTTACIKCLIELEKSGADVDVKTYTPNKTFTFETIQLKLVYIDLSQLSVEKNNDKWFYNQFGKKSQEIFMIQ